MKAKISAEHKINIIKLTLMLETLIMPTKFYTILFTHLQLSGKSFASFNCILCNHVNRLCKITVNVKKSFPFLVKYLLSPNLHVNLLTPAPAISRFTWHKVGLNPRKNEFYGEKNKQKKIFVQVWQHEAAKF